MKPIFYICLLLSSLLFVGGFLAPPMGVIDGSALSASGILFAFATLAQVPHVLSLIHDGRSIRLTHGSTTLEASNTTTNP